MPPSQLLLWSQGRTACHLLERMLSNQPNSSLLWHPFAEGRPAQIALYNEDAMTSGLQDDLRRTYTDCTAEGVAKWERAFDETQAKGEMLFVHEHPQFALLPDVGLEWGTKDWNSGTYAGPANFTTVPDDLLRKPGTCAIFTIRHPVWIITAAVRALTDIEHSANRLNIIIISNLRWQRQLYDWYIANGIKAIIVEAEDYMTNPDLVRKLCSEAGLDPDRALFSWPKATDEEKAAMPPVVAGLLASLLNSTGLIPGNAKPEPVLEVEQESWEKEFGEEMAGLIREMVDNSLPDYEYLKARKLRL